MGQRVELQAILENILGSRNVYYQPPETLKIQYPAIVYKRIDIKNDYANNRPYIQNRRYQLTVIDFDPDSEIVDKVSLLPECSYVNHFTSDNLNHDVFSIVY